MTVQQERSGGVLNPFTHCDELMTFSVYMKSSGGDEERRNDDGAF